MANDKREGTPAGTFPLGVKREISLIILLLIAFFPSSFTGSAQKLSNYYTAAIMDSGMLYFFFPLDDFQEDVSRSPLIFDISYLSSRDSATVNFSYFLSSADPAVSLVLRTGEGETVCKATKLFIDLENHQKWHHRFSTTVLLSDLAYFFRSVLPPEILIKTKDSHYTYTIKKCRWKKHGSIVSVIIEMIQTNS